MKISKKKKAWYQFIFAVALICCGFGSLQVWASSSGYSGCSSDILDMVTVRSQFKDLLRKLEWSILNFLATVIDYFDSAIKTLLKINLYDYLSDEFNFSHMQTAVIAIMSIALLFGAIGLIIFHNKIHISDFLMSLLVSAILLVAFPTFISSCNSLRHKGVTTAQTIKINDKSEQVSVDDEGIVTVGTLGSDLLASGVYDVYNSVGAGLRPGDPAPKPAGRRV